MKVKQFKDKTYFHSPYCKDKKEACSAINFDFLVWLECFAATNNRINTRNGFKT
jgi:hypothetical protein